MIAAVTLPADLVAEFLGGRPDALKRIGAYVYAVGSLRLGRTVTAAQLQPAWGLGRNAAYDLLAMARAAAGADREPTGSADRTDTPVIADSPGADREPTGNRAEPARPASTLSTAPMNGPGADREPTWSADRTDTPVIADSPGADREPTGNRAGPPGDPPPSLTTLSTVDQLEKEGTPPQPEAPVGQLALVPDPAPVFPDAPDRASAAFLVQLRRWATEPDLADRWRIEPAADLTWFLAEVVPRATELGIDDLPETLRKWGAWLEKELRERKARRKSKFPSAWKNALHTWIKNEARWAAQRGGSNGRLSQSGRRGSFGAAGSRFTVETRSGDGHVDEFDG